MSRNLTSPIRRRFALIALTMVTAGTGASAALAAPNVRFVDIPSGPVTGGPGNLGVPITIYGHGFGTTRGGATVTIGDVPVARYLAWGSRTTDGRLERIVVQAGRHVRGGQVVVHRGGVASVQRIGFTAIAGRIFAVSTTGRDTATCTMAKPCATVNRVLHDLMRPGDTVLMRGGTYTESELWIRDVMGESGTATRRITIAPFPRARVVLTNAARPWIVDADYITVAGLLFRNGKALSITEAGLPGHRGVRLIGNTFRGQLGFGAVDSHGDGHLIAGNDCLAAGSTVGTQGHCFYVSYGSGVRLRDNSAGGAPGYGIHVFDQQRQSGDFRRVIRNLVIEGNRLRGSTERSGLILAMGDEGGLGNVIDGVIVRGNVLASNNHLGMVIGTNVRNVTIVGNRFIQNGRQGLDIDGAGTHEIVVRSNWFIQSTNAVCTSNCTWYMVAHLQVAATVKRVRVTGNAYGPGAPHLIGATDSKATRVGG